MYPETAKPAYNLDEEGMRRMLRRPDETRTVSKNGVRFRGIDYLHPALTGLVGETVELGFRDSDPTRLDLFQDELWLGTARPHTHWDKDDEDFYKERNRLFRRARQIRAEASELRSGDTPDRQAAEQAEDDLYDDLALEEDLGPEFESAS